jgi:hypothetical protein
MGFFDQRRRERMNESVKRVNVADESELDENENAIAERLEDTPTYTANLNPGRRLTCSPRMS